MLKVIGCVAHDHDLRLVAMSALICVLGCWTTTTLLVRAGACGRRQVRHWLACAAAVLGCSVWSLHFVAMLAFLPGEQMAYDVGLTVLSVVVAVGGAFAALLAWKSRLPDPARVGVGGLLLGLAISGMHYVGVTAMSFSGFVLLDRPYVAASVAISVAFSLLALSRASDLRTGRRRLEVNLWLALAICGLHFTAMAALTVAPGRATEHGSVFDTTTLAIVVAAVSVAILIASLAAVLIEQHLSQRALKDLGRLRLMSNLAQEVLLIHRDMIIVEINSAGERLFQARAEDIIGRSVLSLFAADCLPALLRRSGCPPHGRPAEEMDIQAADGTRATVELSCQPIDYLGRPATVVVLRDLTARRRDEARIRYLARHDALTDLPNRYNLQERLDLALQGARQQGTTVAVVYIDLDRFKPVNDLHGHAAGDAVLVQVSRRILAELSSADTLSRIGGDEFVMVLTVQPQPEKVSAIAARVIDALRQPFQVEGKRIEIGASIGVAIFPQDGTDPDALMRAADAAMYRVKGEGRGAICFYEAAMNTQLQARLRLEQELAGAVERGELVLHYQPMVSGVTGEVEAFEALVRWAHPSRGMVPPMDFIPLAEETGLIDGIGRWVIQAACREAARWPRPWRVSVNVSPKQFRQSDVCDVLADAIGLNGLDPGRVLVEVTESVLIDDAAKAVATLNRMREIGVGIALDDFGTGFSSLSYLQLFRFDKFKVDKSFIRRLGENEDTLTLTRTMINLGHNLGLQVTAEGVETLAQLAILRSLGCDQIQGYLVGRPAPVGAFGEADQLRAVALFRQERLRLSA